MSKKNQGLPTIGEQYPVISTAATEVQRSYTPAGEELGRSVLISTTAVDVQYVTTETPSEGYLDDENNRRCDLGLLSRDHARKLRAVRRGKDLSGITLNNGKPIKSLPDAVRAILDSLDI